MEFEAILPVIEPGMAFALSVAAIVLAPVVSSVGSAMADSNLGESLSQSARELTKIGLVWGFEAIDNVQNAYERTAEAFRDLVTEAKIEHIIRKSQSQIREPLQIEIVSE